MRKQRALLQTLAACALASAVFLVGCGGTAGQQGAAGGTASQQGAAEDADATTEESAAEEATAADAEAILSGSGVAVGEQPSRTNEDVAGIYLLDDQVSDDVVSAYQLKKDGTFIMSIRAAGQTLERPGTYEIRDDRIYINVPSAGSGTLTIQGQELNYNAEALEDVEITVEDGVLSRKSEGDSEGVVAHKVSRKEYKQLVKKADALGPQTVKVGKTVSADGYTFTVNSFEFKDEIYPSDTSGYYTYWQHEDDHDYLVADVSYTNEGTEYQVPGKATGALLSIGENKYSATIEIDGGSRMSSSYSIDPKDTGRIIILASIPDAAREDGAEVKLTWVFPKDPALLNHYFSSDAESKLYILTM